MAALTADQWKVSFTDSQSDLFALYLVKNVNTGDTLDVSGHFKSAKLAAVLWTTTAKKDGLAAPVSNVVTLSTTGLSNDSGWLMVWGSAA